jgi:dephospho-CoA kinase
MKRIAIAGGIGAGKSLACDFLVKKGFSVIDSDDVAHQIVEPGKPAWQAIRDAFGDSVLQSDQSINREFLAKIIFSNDSARNRLNSITHPAIGIEVLNQIEACTTPAVFIALPLFRAEHRQIFSLDSAWAVLVSPEIAKKRLIDHRGFSENDAQARIDTQVSNEVRSSIVDKVIWNEGTPAELEQGLNEALASEGLLSG